MPAGKYKTINKILIEFKVIILKLNVKPKTTASTNCIEQKVRNKDLTIACHCQDQVRIRSIR